MCSFRGQLIFAMEVMRKAVMDAVAGLQTMTMDGTDAIVIQGKARPNAVTSSARAKTPYCRYQLQCFH
jgi:hypothetical protein